MSVRKESQKSQNNLRWQCFKAALKGTGDMATNRGFRMQDGRMVTYEQGRLGLSAYYNQHWVLADRKSHRTNGISHLVGVN